MNMHPWIALVTLLALLVYFATSVMVGRARGRHGIQAPAMTGHPDFERAVRVQANTLEWLVMFVPSLWLFAWYVSVPVGAIVGGIWIAGRVAYAVGYMQAAARRGPGFAIQALATLVLLLGGLAGAIGALLHRAAQG